MPSCETLDFSRLEFEERIDLANLNLEHANFNGTRLAYAIFDGSSLLHATFCGALLSHATFRSASLHDADLSSAWANDLVAQEAALYRSNLSGADLRNGDFTGARAHEAVMSGATLWRAKLVGCELYRADLRGADCWCANLENAELSGALLEGTNLSGADLKGASLGNVRKENTTYVVARLEGARFAGAKWDGAFILSEETQGLFVAAREVYRCLRENHQRAGYYEVADEFAFREQVAARKQARVERRWLTFASLMCGEVVFGYGYRWRRVVAACFVTYLLFTAIYWLGGLTGGHGWRALAESAYFSAVSFSGVGYGPWIADYPSCLKYLGAVEAPCGISLLALLLVTFARRFTRQ
jgi:uncharacterized protein YjbI with pentapeptide repeats